jgi:hypothetical protein
MQDCAADAEEVDRIVGELFVPIRSHSAIMVAGFWQDQCTNGRINKFGQIVADGSRSIGQNQVFLLSPVNPVPETGEYILMLVALGLIGEITKGRKQQNVSNHGLMLQV